MQCCGSGSIRIRIIFWDPDPFPGVLESGSVSYGTLMSTTKLAGRENLTKYAFWLGPVGTSDKKKSS
jgi:hypothetical protein